MGHYVHKTFTAVGESTAWAAEVSALQLSIEGTAMAEHFSVALGRNGAVAVTLMPHGGKSGTDWSRKWLALKVCLRRAAVRTKISWCEVSWGADHEGPPTIETEGHQIRGGTCIDKWGCFPENYVDDDPDDD